MNFLDSCHQVEVAAAAQHVLYSLSPGTGQYLRCLQVSLLSYWGLEWMGEGAGVFHGQVFFGSRGVGLCCCVFRWELGLVVVWSVLYPRLMGWTHSPHMCPHVPVHSLSSPENLPTYPVPPNPRISQSTPSLRPSFPSLLLDSFFLPAARLSSPLILFYLSSGCSSLFYAVSFP